MIYAGSDSEGVFVGITGDGLTEDDVQVVANGEIRIRLSLDAVVQLRRQLARQAGLHQVEIHMRRDETRKGGSAMR